MTVVSKQRKRLSADIERGSPDRPGAAWRGGGVRSEGDASGSDCDYAASWSGYRLQGNWRSRRAPLRSTVGSHSQHHHYRRRCRP